MHAAIGVMWVGDIDRQQHAGAVQQAPALSSKRG